MTNETDWQSALADIEAALIEERQAIADDDVDAKSNITLACFARLLPIHPPTIQDAHRKLQIIRDVECGSPSEESWNAILADMAALADATPAHMLDADEPVPTPFSKVITASAQQAGIEAKLVTADQTSWKTPAFEGSRCIITITATRSRKLVDWLATLPSADLKMPGALVADIAVTSVAPTGPEAVIIIEGLTIKECAEEA